MTIPYIPEEWRRRKCSATGASNYTSAPITCYAAYQRCKPTPCTGCEMNRGYPAPITPRRHDNEWAGGAGHNHLQYEMWPPAFQVNLRICIVRERLLRFNAFMRSVGTPLEPKPGIGCQPRRSRATNVQAFRS